MSTQDFNEEDRIFLQSQYYNVFSYYEIVQCLYHPPFLLLATNCPLTRIPQQRYLKNFTKGKQFGTLETLRYYSRSIEMFS